MSLQLMVQIETRARRGVASPKKRARRKKDDYNGGTDRRAECEALSIAAITTEVWSVHALLAGIVATIEPGEVLARLSVGGLESHMSATARGPHEGSMGWSGCGVRCIRGLGLVMPGSPLSVELSEMTSRSGRSCSPLAERF
jgi:hypothetical protein